MKPLVLVAGALANKPHNGGAAWTRLSWVLGLRQMGFEVRFIETIDALPGQGGIEDRRDALSFSRGDLAADAAAVKGTPRERGGSLSKQEGRSRNGLEGSGDRRAAVSRGPADFFRQTLAQFGVPGILLDGDAARHSRWEEAREWASQCQFLLNITGHLREPRLLELVRRKAYLDLDPGYTQIWHHQGHDLGLQNHDLHFTIGENIGKDFCPIPACDFCWIPTRQPSLLDQWPALAAANPHLFTTVASWRNPYGGLEFQGRKYGQKAHEFRRFIDLPRQLAGLGGGSASQTEFELALDIHTGDEEDRRALEERGWRISQARRLNTPDAFRRYVRDSGAEFSVAQGVYVHTQSGWFSDRTVRYLSSGRPALVQDTGLGHNIPLGDGLLTFRTLEEAADGVRRIADDYDRHSRAARRLAESHFDSRSILEAFLQRIG
ncbi:MAG TPA: hypothetical protein VLV83_09295 [Acidobacteriota bacterium]|nr:hypothetical protein [Acidobacteriota bacterium]